MGEFGALPERLPNGLKSKQEEQTKLVRMKTLFYTISMLEAEV